jgi:poly-gamma-glutamate capsule biosynthesis protein CapA/YwtB (metallophosphatase superfamily)
MKFLISAILLILLPEILSAVIPEDTSRLKLIFAGDLMGHDEQIYSAWNQNSDSYEYDTCFSMIRKYVSSADLSFLNLEVSLAGPPYKGYPEFSSPDELALAAKKAGFDVFITANNHSLDRGKKGLERTIFVLDSLRISHTGTFINPQKRELEYPLIIEKNNIRLAILNYTYGTNGLKVTEPNIVNYIDTLTIANDLKKAKLATPDFTIVTMHWGTEYQRIENNQQQVLAAFIFRHGADIIIGSHPHVIQPVRKYYPDRADSSVYNIVVYSLGNFISNQRERYRDGGLIFGFSLEKTDKTRISGYETYPVYVHKPYSGNWAKYFVLLPANNFEEMVKKYKMSSEDKEKFRVFKEDTEMKLKEGLFYSGKY